jgi:PAS domain S-box-containing protein
MLLQQHIVAQRRQIFHASIRRLCVGLLLVVFYAHSAYAGEKDSLRQSLLKNTLNDTARALVLERLVGLSMEAQPDTALVYAWQLHIIAEKNSNDKHLMLRALNALVNGYIHYDKSDKVLKYGFQLLHLAEELHDTAYLARACYAIGHASGQLFTKNDTKENSSALQYLRQALEIAEWRHDTVLMAQCYNATGRIYRKEEQFDSAMVYHSQALALATTVKSTVQQGWALHSLAICYENKGNLAKALEYALEGLHYREQVGNVIVAAFSYSLVTRLYQQSGNLRQALLYAERGLALAKTAEFRTAQYQAYERIAQIQEALGNYREALFYQRRFATVRDSVAILERTEDVRSLQAELKLEHSERERTLLVKEQEVQGLALQRQQIFVVVMALGFILLVIVALVLLRVQRRQNFQRQEITKLKRILDESSDYVVMSEIASGNVLYMNKAYLSLINAKTPPATLSELLHRVYEPAIAETVLNTHLPLVIKHERLSGETSLLDHNGKQIAVLHTTICHYDEQGEAVLVSSVMRDISERKQAEEESLTNNRFIQTVTDSLPGVLGYWTSDLRCSFANSAYLQWFGKTHEEMIGIDMRDLLGETLFQNNEPYICAVLEGKPQQFEREFLKANGNFDHILVQYTPNIFNGRVLGFIALVTDITTVKKAQNSLNEAQHLARIGSWEWDIASNTITWSDEQYHIFGENSNTYQPTLEGYYTHLTVEEQQKTSALVNKVLAGTAEYSIEHEITRPDDGTVLFVLEQGTVIYDSNEKPLRMVGTTQDISERKRMEDELRKLSMVASKTTNAVYMTDTEGNITWVNNGFTSLTEYSIDEALGKRPGHLLRGEKTDPAIIQTINDSLQQGKSFDVELLNYTKSKNPFWLHIIGDPIVDDNGILTGFITIQTDITERKKAEEQQLQKLSMVASKTTNAVVITDAEYRITWVNEGYTRLTEYSLDEVRGEEPECSSQQSQIDQLVMERMRSAVTKRISFEGEVMNYAKNGRLYWVHIKTDPFFDDDGTLAGFVSIKTDITERKQAELALQDSEERYRLIFENSNDAN